MMKLTDGTRTVEITMTSWNGSGYDPDWSMDFFAVGSLPYDEETETYTVPDVGYCIEQAEDWEAAIGDFREDLDAWESEEQLEEDIDNRRVFVNEL